MRLRIDAWATLERAAARYWAACAVWAVGIVLCANLTSHRPHPAPPPPPLVQCQRALLQQQQLCSTGKNVQLPMRMALFKLLVDRGVVYTMQWVLARPEGEPEGRRMIAVGGEVLTTLLDHNVNGVLQQFERVKSAGAGGGEKKRKREQTLLVQLCSMQPLVGSADARRHALDDPRDTAGGRRGSHGAWLSFLTLFDGGCLHAQCLGRFSRSFFRVQQIPTKMFSHLKDDPKSEQLLGCFHKLCIHSLLKPVLGPSQAAVLMYAARIKWSRKSAGVAW